MEEDLVFFKRNVNYTVGVRLFVGDRDGVVLTTDSPTIGIAAAKLREFKNANKQALLSGSIIEIEEPLIDWETPNALSDEDIDILLKNHLKLKSEINLISSLPILYKLIGKAKERDLSKRTISLIQARIDEVEPDDFAISREDMQGVK